MLRTKQASCGSHNTNANNYKAQLYHSRFTLVVFTPEAPYSLRHLPVIWPLPIPPPPCCSSHPAHPPPPILRPPAHPVRPAFGGGDPLREEGADVRVVVVLVLGVAEQHLRLQAGQLQRHLLTHRQTVTLCTQTHKHTDGRLSLCADKQKNTPTADRHSERQTYRRQTVTLYRQQTDKHTDGRPSLCADKQTNGRELVMYGDIQSIQTVTQGENIQTADLHSVQTNRQTHRYNGRVLL